MCEENWIKIYKHKMNIQSNFLKGPVTGYKLRLPRLCPLSVSLVKARVGHPNLNYELSNTNKHMVFGWLIYVECLHFLETIGSPTECSHWKWIVLTLNLQEKSRLIPHYMMSYFLRMEPFFIAFKICLHIPRFLQWNSII